MSTSSNTLSKIWIDISSHDSDWFQTPHWKRVCVLCFILRSERADTSCEGRAAVGGRCYSSSSDLSAPVITPYTPQSGLLLACQSQRGAPPRRLNRLSAASCRCWLASGTALTYKHVEYRAACCCIVCVCQCLFRGYGTLYFSCRLMAVKSH